MERTTPRFQPEGPPEARPGQTGDSLGDQAKAAGADLKRHAKDLADDAKAQARSIGGAQKAAAAEQMHGFARALRTAADDLNQRDQRLTAGLVEQAADGLERVSGELNDRDPDQVVAGVEDFARRQPVAFLGGAVVAGFALARFMKSSAERRRPPASGYAPTPGERP